MEDVMVWLLAFEILLALIIIFVVLRWQSASLVGRRKNFAVTQRPSQSDLTDAGGRSTRAVLQLSTAAGNGEART
jgi:hypothetical protein